jgi:hypothetical protein
MNAYIHHKNTFWVLLIAFITTYLFKKVYVTDD